jgi:hypothetical protein
MPQLFDIGACALKVIKNPPNVLHLDVALQMLAV